ncbi:hypothetical protein LMCDFJHI_02266 [Aeromonas salmonicida]
MQKGSPRAALFIAGQLLLAGLEAEAAYLLLQPLGQRLELGGLSSLFARLLGQLLRNVAYVLGIAADLAGDRGLLFGRRRYLGRHVADGTYGLVDQ